MRTPVVYENFELETSDFESDGGGERFSVRVLNSPVGNMRPDERETVTLPSTLRRRLRQLEQRSLHLPELIDLGDALANVIFPPLTREFLQDSRREVRTREHGLRIQLRLDTYGLAAIPWEYVYLAEPDTPPDQRGPQGFLALRPRTSIVRYESVGRRPLEALEPIHDDRLRLVALLANPDDPAFPRLDLKRERIGINDALKTLDIIDLSFYDDATIDTFEDALQSPAQIFHFAGHGMFEGELGAKYGTLSGKGFLVLVGSQREATPFAAERVAVNLANQGVRLAVLDACNSSRRDDVHAWSGIAPVLTQNGIPGVIGMQFTIADENAIWFCEGLYRSLAEGQPIDVAVADGRRRIFNRAPDAERDWGVPVLYLRTYDEGILFPRPRLLDGTGDACAPASVSVRPTNVWADVCARAAKQTRSFLPEEQGTAERPGLPVPGVHVRRTAAEEQLKAFLASKARALVLLGASGTGKTTLLRQWTLDLLAGGHAAFFYACDTSVESDVEMELKRDLSMTATDDLFTALHQLSDIAEQEGRQFVLVFDAVNQFRDRDAGADHLLRHIDALVRRLPERNVRVVLSSSTAAWRQLERRRGIHLSTGYYYQFSDDGVGITLGNFDDRELVAAYEQYRQRFQLQAPLKSLSVSVQESLRDPLFLRLFAEAYAHHTEPIPGVGLAVRILDRYVRARVPDIGDLVFAGQLAAEMRSERRTVLSLDSLAYNPTFAPKMIWRDEQSSYFCLLEASILVEQPNDVGPGEVVRFAHPRIGAYVLAWHLKNSGEPIAPAIGELVRESVSFPLAWDTARWLLLMSRDPATIRSLARSVDIEMREMAVEALIEFQADDPGGTRQTIRDLLQDDAEEARRTGLKAAYRIGAGARDIFLWAATDSAPTVKQAARDTLYLLWRTDPVFVYGLLDELVAGIGLPSPNKVPALIRLITFVIDLSVTIYINHCDRDDVTQRTSALYLEMLKSRLHLDLLGTGFVGPLLEKLAVQAVSQAFAKPILSTALLSEVKPAERFFKQPPEDRACLRRMANWLDPNTDLRLARDDLAEMLRSEVTFFNIVGGLALAVHACANFETVEPLARDLFEDLPPAGRLWELLAFTVLVERTPPGWIRLLEEFTRRLVEDHPAVFYCEEPTILAQCDIVLAPLGLAYGKQGDGMPYMESLIRQGLVQGDLRLIERCLAGLAVVGFYYPNAVFRTLGEPTWGLSDPQLEGSLVRLLATMRTLHFDAVDAFLGQIGASEHFQRRVSAATDVSLVQRYIHWLGLYNNAVHFSVNYPKMRRGLSSGALIILADAHSLKSAVASYTQRVMQMTHEAQYQLIEWTLPT